MAHSWKPSHDFRAWTIHLRKGIRWHDGVPVTAHDLKFTLDLLKNPELLGFAPSSYTVDVLDDQTCQIAYERQYLWDEGALSDYIACWPKHLLENHDPKQINTWDFWKWIVGCGPYRHLRTVPGTMMEFEANPDYFRGKPRIEKVILKFGGTNAVPELLSSEVDAVCGPQRTDVLNLSRDSRFRTHQHPIAGGLAVWWNLRHPLFEDAVVRRALTHAITGASCFK